MNILEQLQKQHPRQRPQVTVKTGNVVIGEEFEFASRKALAVGETIYINDHHFGFGYAVITRNPTECQYFAKRTK